MFKRAFKSEAYRLSRMKSAYILPVILAVLILLINFIYMRIDLYGLMGFSQKDIEGIQQMGTSAEGFEESFMTGFQAGLNSADQAADEPEELKILGEGPFFYEDVATIYTLDTGSLYILLMLSIFTGLYTGDIYSSGIDKNMNTFAGKRWVVYAVRIFVLSLYALALSLLSWLISLVSCALFGESVRVGFDKAFFLYFIITWLLEISFVTLTGAVTHLTRSKAAGITVGVILAAGLFSSMLSVASLILKKQLDLSGDFNIGNYTLTQNVASLTLNSDGHFVMRALILSVVYFAAAYVTGLVVITKRDIS